MTWPGIGAPVGLTQNQTSESQPLHHILLAGILPNFFRPCLWTCPRRILMLGCLGRFRWACSSSLTRQSSCPFVSPVDRPKIACSWAKNLAFTSHWISFDFCGTSAFQARRSGTSYFKEHLQLPWQRDMLFATVCEGTKVRKGNVQNSKKEIPNWGSLLGFFLIHGIKLEKQGGRGKQLCRKKLFP